VQSASGGTMTQKFVWCLLALLGSLGLAACGGGGGAAAPAAVIVTPPVVTPPVVTPPVVTPPVVTPPVVTPPVVVGPWGSRNLVWSDEFDGTGLPSTSNWDYDTERNSLGWFNNELQYYSRGRAENSRVEGGKLIITARKEALTTASDYGGQQYTSARLLTRGKANWTYGFFEIRAKLPCGTGTWPAIWMLGTGGRWPEDGEIDIMEQRGNNKTVVLGTIHTRAYNYFNGTLGVGQGSQATVVDACTNFHNYQMTWTADKIVIGVDGVNYFEYVNPNTGEYNRWPFGNSQFLILNLAIGGDLGGPVDPAFTTQQMEVDYVRVYQ
jgi:beta-glucanase (GH16 family)